MLGEKSSLKSFATVIPGEIIIQIIKYIYQLFNGMTLTSDSVLKGFKKNKTIFSQVKALKQRIEEEKGKDNFSVSGLKLIYAGMFSYDSF